mmetsp:Transcript_18770/g.29567  ORF Transcript_18770/g.29567 Transcript_18770/m.29567 type:complete len:280 (-) Transcript_18770:628-1467(-)
MASSELLFERRSDQRPPTKFKPSPMVSARPKSLLSQSLQPTHDSGSMLSSPLNPATGALSSSLKGGIKGLGKQEDIPMKKSVSFQSVEVSVFAPCIGDNPSVSSGVPLSMSPNAFHQYSTSVDHYESSTPKLPSSAYQRHGRIPAERRLELAEQTGASYDELKLSLRSVREAKPKSIWNLYQLPHNIGHKKTKKQFLKHRKSNGNPDDSQRSWSDSSQIGYTLSPDNTFSSNVPSPRSGVQAGHDHSTNTWADSRQSRPQAERLPNLASRNDLVFDMEL